MNWALCLFSAFFNYIHLNEPLIQRWKHDSSFHFFASWRKTQPGRAGKINKYYDYISLFEVPFKLKITKFNFFHPTCVHDYVAFLFVHILICVFIAWLLAGIFCLNLHLCRVFDVTKRFSFSALAKPLIH